MYIYFIEQPLSFEERKNQKKNHIRKQNNGDITF